MGLSITSEADPVKLHGVRENKSGHLHHSPLRPPPIKGCPMWPIRGWKKAAISCFQSSCVWAIMVGSIRKVQDFQPRCCFYFLSLTLIVLC